MGPDREVLNVFDIYLKWRSVCANVDVAESGMFLYVRIRMGARLEKIPPPVTVVGGSVPLQMQVFPLPDDGGQVSPLVVSLWVGKVEPRAVDTVSETWENFSFAVRDDILILRSDTRPQGSMQDPQSQSALVAKCNIMINSFVKVRYQLERKLTPEQASKQRENLRKIRELHERKQRHSPLKIIGGSTPPQQRTYRPLPLIDKSDPDAALKMVYIHNEPDLQKLDMVWILPTGHHEDPRSYYASRTLPGSTYPTFDDQGIEFILSEPNGATIELPQTTEKKSAHYKAALEKAAEYSRALEIERFDMARWRATEAREEQDRQRQQQDRNESSADDSAE
mmetsp:Transcript_321/g.555  ORF Transcript_321/g.555 Transcript_321/m.555 type:complete len:337 (-) Transcript_321:1882-2892(-)